MNIHAVIMAGGVGARFWPRSREKSPKQLLEIVGPGTMIQNVIHRIEPIIQADNILIITNKALKTGVSHQVPNIPMKNIIVEPVGRNTAPCVGLAALFIRRSDPQGVMMVLPSDHIIQNVEEFLRILELGINVAYSSGALVTIGIQPNRPETGYGYIQVIDEDDGTNPYFEKGVYKVKTFAEKPDPPTAEMFLKSGDFFWNSGIFIWRVDVILREIEEHLPELYEGLMKIDRAIGSKDFDTVLSSVFGQIRSISIDYGVMEKAQRVYVIKGDFGWSDIGSWDEVYRITTKDENKNCLTGKVIAKDTKGTMVYSPKKLVATIGVEDLIIINTEDALLVCKAGRSQEVKEVVDHIKRKQMHDYL
jgi:mannose-1-phosphate guanylyltransferase